MYSQIQAKHRTQSRDLHGKVSEQGVASTPTDRGKNKNRARGTHYNQPNQPQSRKQKTKGQ